MPYVNIRVAGTLSKEQKKKISKGIKPESPDAPAPEEKDDEEKQPLPSLVNPKERPAPA